MAAYDPNKRLKFTDGTPIQSSASTGAANLTAWQPPAALVGAGRVSTSTTPTFSAVNGNKGTASIVERPPNGSRLTLKVKTQPSKLREATSSSQLHSAPIPPNPYADRAGAISEPGRNARSTRNPRRIVEEEDDDDESNEDEDEDAEGEDDVDLELLAHEDSDEDAEGEEMEDLHPPPPIIKQRPVQAGTRTVTTVSAPVAPRPLKSVEAKESAMDSASDDELSELEENSNADSDGMDRENMNDDDDALGESDDDDMDNSRSATPDLSKLTRRQRGFHEELAPAAEAGLVALSNETQKKKHFTDEEHAMRRTEMARRRKNLSEKRNEEEKMDTINKLLSKPAPKRRTRAEMIAAQQLADNSTPGGAMNEEGEYERADPLFSRSVSNRNGSRLGVPQEWTEQGRGLFERAGSSGMMVEEVA